MKTQVIILVIFSTQITAQNQKFPKVKLSVPCTNEIANNYKGKWLIHKNELSSVSVKDNNTETLKRINQLHQLVFETYPEPTGGDAGWNGSFIKTSFADQVKFEWNQNNMFNEEHVKINPVYRYQYNMIVYPWSCCGTYDICNIYPEISGGVGLTIHGNYLEILKGNYLKGNEWTINGRPIKIKMPVMGKWRNYDVMTSEGGANAQLFSQRFILIHRKGILPYIPVTRKQFFDRAIPYVTKFYDDIIKNTDQIPDKSTRDDSKKGFIKDKEDAIKRLKDELDQTTNEGELDSPAIISAWDITMTNGPVFSTEADGGYMLATENPDYFRKDLPMYIPQFFVFSWSWQTDGYRQVFTQAINEKFPIEKLQAMIDK